MKKVVFLMLVLFFGLGDIAFGQTYVDLGLASGTKWSNVNEDGHYSYNQAVSRFGSNLPTRTQWEELMNDCEWKWRDGVGGWKVTGPNGKSITLPAAGYRDCDGVMDIVGSNGLYWSSTPFDSENAWFLTFAARDVRMYRQSRCLGYSVRLVQD